MNFLVFGVCARLVVRVILDREGGMPANSEIIESLMESVALRLITVGVVMLERHEILEMAGGADASSRHDPLADLSQPYGMFYLCGGLIMECLIDALKHPFRLTAGPTHEAIFLSASMLFALISLLVSLRYGYDLLVWRKQLPHQKG